MDGGAIFPDGDRAASVWQRDGSVYFCPEGGAECLLGKGTQPVALATSQRRVAVWQQGAALWTTALDVKPAPHLLAAQARFPALIALPDRDHVLIAYERGAGVIVNVVNNDGR